MSCPRSLASSEEPRSTATAAASRWLAAALSAESSRVLQRLAGIRNRNISNRAPFGILLRTIRALVRFPPALQGHGHGRSDGQACNTEQDLVSGRAYRLLRVGNYLTDRAAQARPPIHAFETGLHGSAAMVLP